jgi:plasmid stabilization system protein ParE
MAQLKWTVEALDWLEDIYSYIALDNPSAADKVVDGIVAKAELLVTFPEIGSRLRSVPEGEVRMVLYGHYRIAYLRHGERDVVEILGVFHGALDIERYLK